VREYSLFLLPSFTTFDLKSGVEARSKLPGELHIDETRQQLHYEGIQKFKVPGLRMKEKK
jgi:hypothetical protein